MIDLSILHANMVDLLILCLISWFTIIGWRRGGYRSLLDCMSIGSAIAVVVFTIPLFRDQLIDGDWAWQLRNWIHEMMRTVPTFGFSNAEMGPADKLYHLLIVGAGALTVWIGIQMILQVFQTVWKEPSGSIASRVTGTLLGTCIGSVFSIYMVQCLGPLSWLRGWEALDHYLAKSFFVWAFMNLMVI
ncbi:CvpA family protein [Effusibacillus consociatus]|uniref:CvpA family protein n=1 Tax=Effusibacillus consociatus TaxID=1117041 RepID=A0ABV9Q2M0_9BACL